MKPVDIETARLLLDFSGGDPQLKTLAKLQLEGAVALQNMLANPDIGIGYLADEVGMGKTYVALGTIALMRYFNPALRVLYICPSHNVQEKWHEKELPNFIKKNIISNSFTLRTPQGDSGTPSISCSNIEELINAATTGYYGDIFVRMSSFSNAMGEDDEGLKNRIEWLKERVPASIIGRGNISKEGVKKSYANAINYLLPIFDLVVIDEAHNFKSSFESSARNLALSRILGFNKQDSEEYRPLVKNALLLSATPFDVNPIHLYNQLNLIGKTYLIPDPEQWTDKSLLKKSMAKFMVRRLNELTICGKQHTRNMYRREWRKGERAEVGFESDEHKLITALVQKHVGDLLNKQGGNPAFQLGMLASFESYAQTSRSGPVEFDGEKQPEGKNDAQDRHLIAVIRDSYVDENKFGKSLPHPKMDQVSREVANLAFDNARKQLVFVRRVKSVDEFKQKLDDEYDAWLQRHIASTLRGYGEQSGFIANIVSAYEKSRKQRVNDISGGEAIAASGNEEENLPPQNDTLFNWLFRGEKSIELEAALSTQQKKWPTPDVIKKSLISKNNANVLLFEMNWATWVAEKVFGSNLDALLETLGNKEFLAALSNSPSVAADDVISIFLSFQTVFLRLVAKQHPDKAGITDLVDYLSPLIRQGEYKLADISSGKDLLATQTFFSHLYNTGTSEHFFSSPTLLLNAMQKSSQSLHESIHRVEIHRQLIAQSFRTGHPVIDLYLARLQIGDGELNEARRQQWMRQICHMLNEQIDLDGFSTAKELARLNDCLDLIIKSNLPSVYSRKSNELRVWLNWQLPSSAPIIGANGETSANRSVQARKFRMPGYPLVLVSTDVFQEGEDLHTFCDSVVHYGLSSSPVSIEQKTGRVDRVGAFAHRKLLGLSGNQTVTDDDFIQVRFPFVKQSIEAIQVRTLCNNLNAFIGSLHEIGGSGVSMDEFVDSSRELANRNEIPDQLFSFLKSPYIPPVSVTSSPGLYKKVQDNNIHDSAAVKHITGLVEAYSGSKISRNSSLVLNSETSNNALFDVQLNSARSCGEMLLRVSHSARIDVIQNSSYTADQVIDYQKKLISASTCRTYAIKENDGLCLYNDAEMLVGGSGLTCKQDIAGLVDRFSSSSQDIYSHKDMPIFSDSEINKYLWSKFRWNATLSIKNRKHSIEMLFRFNNDKTRKHLITVRTHGSYCIFESMVAEKHTVKRLSKDRLLNLTWLRNRNIDLVEFIIDVNDRLTGRTFHPLSSMGFEEFAFSAYILAVESDRLEYLIKEPDEY